MIASLSELLTTALHSDETARRRLLALGPCCIRVCIEPFGALGIHVHEGAVTIGDAPAEADLEVRGPIASFARLGLAGRASGIHFAGDAERAQALRALFAELDVDWEGLAAQAVGDEPARLLGILGRAAAHGVRTVARASEDNLRDYLQEESGQIATGEEITDFVRAVDRLRDDIERLELRLRRLET